MILLLLLLPDILGRCQGVYCKLYGALASFPHCYAIAQSLQVVQLSQLFQYCSLLQQQVHVERFSRMCTV